MTMSEPSARPNDDEESLQSLVARAMSMLERGARGSVDGLCREHPEHESGIRRAIAELEDLGLVPDPADDNRIGPYHMVRRLGEGGMGTVFEAQQDEPVHRRVAIKVARTGLSSPLILARFELERSALASMNHTNIAKLSDVGETRTGQPFFAMELIEGPSLTRYSDERRLGVEDRTVSGSTTCTATSGSGALTAATPVPSLVTAGASRRTSTGGRFAAAATSPLTGISDAG